MNLVTIKDYEDLYSFDLNTNLVWGHKHKKYLKRQLNKDGYYQIILSKNNKLKGFQFHRLVYEYNIGEIPTGLCIDHIDNNPQNNNIDNLRLATISENSCNKKVSKNNKLGYKNITLSRCNTYNVRIGKNNKMVYDKCFKNLDEAILNRDLQLILIHGEFHNLE